MARIVWVLCLLLVPQTDEDAAALLKAVQEKAQKAKSLRVGVIFAFSESGVPGLAFSGEVRAKGSSQWLIDFMTTKGDGLEEELRIAFEQILLRCSFRELVEDQRDPDPRSLDAGFSKADVRVRRDSSEETVH